MSIPHEPKHLLFPLGTCMTYHEHVHHDENVVGCVLVQLVLLVCVAWLGCSRNDNVTSIFVIADIKSAMAAPTQAGSKRDQRSEDKQQAQRQTLRPPPPRQARPTSASTRP